ncbi:unnamed protein product, partial [Didymodactylos carnosus]
AVKGTQNEVLKKAKTTLNNVVELVLTDCKRETQKSFDTENPVWLSPDKWAEYIKQKRSESITAASTLNSVATTVRLGATALAMASVISENLSLFFSSFAVACVAAKVSVEASEKVKTIENNDDEICFHNIDAANEFIEAVKVMVYELCKSMVVTVGTKVNKEAKNVNDNLCDFLRKCTSGIFTRANKRLNARFEIQTAAFKQFDMNVEESKQEFVVPKSKYRSWTSLWLLELESDEIIPNANQSVSRKKLKAQCEELIKRNIHNIETQIKQNFSTDLTKTFEDHFEKLEAYFQMYQSSINASLHDKTLNKEEMIVFKEKLENLLVELENGQNDLRQTFLPNDVTC